MSVSSAGSQSNAFSSASTISGDGRFVAFHSPASNLVAGDTNAFADVFVHDRRSGTTQRVSVDSMGAQANSSGEFPAISAGGRFVAFESFASNLVAADTNGAVDVFVRDLQNATTERVSLGAGGAEGNGPSFDVTISADGRFVAFASHANNFAAGDTNGAPDVFLRDRQTGTIERVSVGAGGAQAAGDSFNPSISDDGRFVAFYSWASNLVAGDTNSQRDVFVRDRQNGTTERVSVDSNGIEANVGSTRPSISVDGRHVAFHSSATNLVAGDTNSVDDVFVHDRQSGITERVSVDSAGTQGNSSSDSASISADGRLVSFQSYATNLVAGDTSFGLDVFVHDRQTGTTERVSLTMDGSQGNGESTGRSISTTGRFVAFHSIASNLVAGDTNGFTDVFVRDRSGPPRPLAFCFGDGSGAACPCGTGAAGNGCPNSVNANGASLVASGTSSTTADTLVLSGSGMPDSSALYFQGSAQIAGGTGAAFGDGLRCAGGASVRLGTKTNAGGASHYPEAGDASISVRGGVTAPGLRTYQVWYRNAAAFCTPATFNFTNAVAVAWTL